MRIDRDHFSGGQSPFLDYLRIVNFVASNLGSETHNPILGDFITGWAKAVSIQACTRNDSVAENQSGRAVPWLIETSMIFVKRL
jgi:hypothetical protein